MLKVGDKLPAGSLSEFVKVEGNGCAIGPNTFDIEKAPAGKTIAVFALPGAFTPTCSSKHVPGYIENAAAFAQAGVDEIRCARLAWGTMQSPAGRTRPGWHAGRQAVSFVLQGRPGKSAGIGVALSTRRRWSPKAPATGPVRPEGRRSWYARCRPHRCPRRSEAAAVHARPTAR